MYQRKALIVMGMICKFYELPPFQKTPAHSLLVSKFNNWVAWYEMNHSCSRFSRNKNPEVTCATTQFISNLNRTDQEIHPDPELSVLLFLGVRKPLPNSWFTVYLYGCHFSLKIKLDFSSKYRSYRFRVKHILSLWPQPILEALMKPNFLDLHCSEG